MQHPTLGALGATVTRIGLGLVLIAHSVYLKMVVFTLAGTAQFFGSLGLPPAFAYVVFAIETLAGIALVVGWHSRIAALAVVPILGGATWAHWSAGWLFTNPGGGWEYPAYLTLLAVAQVLLGNGAYALSAATSAQAHSSTTGAKAVVTTRQPAID